MRIGIIGAGNMGATLGACLRNTPVAVPVSGR
jgi:predicted dinucleotide-binding enzyme